MVLNRLIEPTSEHELPNWLETTALGDLLGFHAEGWAEDRFYRINDKLLATMPALEEHLRRKERDLFNLDQTILLYDLTNSYFEGTAAKKELARRSVASKEKRSDCPLISVGVVLDAEGFITRVEDAFRGMKSELGLHPFHHQLARRCRAHIWITVLAYHLLRWTEHSLKLSGCECTWRTVRRRLDTHCYATLVLEDETGL